MLWAFLKKKHAIAILLELTKMFACQAGEAHHAFVPDPKRTHSKFESLHACIVRTRMHCIHSHAFHTLTCIEYTHMRCVYTHAM